MPTNRPQPTIKAKTTQASGSVRSRVRTRNSCRKISQKFADERDCWKATGIDSTHQGAGYGMVCEPHREAEKSGQQYEGLPMVAEREGYAR